MTSRRTRVRRAVALPDTGAEVTTGAATNPSVHSTDVTADDDGQVVDPSEALLSPEQECPSVLTLTRGSRSDRPRRGVTSLAGGGAREAGARESAVASGVDDVDMFSGGDACSPPDAMAVSVPRGSRSDRPRGVVGDDDDGNDSSEAIAARGDDGPGLDHVLSFFPERNVPSPRIGTGAAPSVLAPGSDGKSEAVAAVADGEGMVEDDLGSFPVTVTSSATALNGADPPPADPMAMVGISTGMLVEAVLRQSAALSLTDFQAGFNARMDAVAPVASVSGNATSAPIVPAAPIPVAPVAPVAPGAPVAPVASAAPSVVPSMSATAAPVLDGSDRSSAPQGAPTDHRALQRHAPAPAPSTRRGDGVVIVPAVSMAREPRLNQAQRARLLFYFRREACRHAAAGGKARLGARSRRAWATELHIIGGELAVKAIWSKWKAEVQRSAIEIGAAERLRGALEVGKKYSYIELGDIAGPLGIKNLDCLIIRLEKSGHFVATRRETMGGEALMTHRVWRYRLTGATATDDAAAATAVAATVVPSTTKATADATTATAASSAGAAAYAASAAATTTATTTATTIAAPADATTSTAGSTTTMTAAATAAAAIAAAAAEAATARDEAIQRRRAPLSAQEQHDVERAVLHSTDSELFFSNADDDFKNFNVELKGKDFKTLMPLTWLNDEVINFYFGLLQQRDNASSSKSSFFFKSFFVDKLMNVDRSTQLAQVQAEHAFAFSNAGGRDGDDGERSDDDEDTGVFDVVRDHVATDTTPVGKYNYKAVKRWTRKVDVFSREHLFFAVHVSEDHWTLAVVHVQEQKIQYYDSMGGGGRHVLEALRRWLGDEKAKKRPAGVSVPDVDVGSFVLVGTTPDTPRQENGSDCGVFSLMCADFLSERLGLPFSQRDIPHFRHRIALALLRRRAG